MLLIKINPDHQTYNKVLYLFLKNISQNLAIRTLVRMEELVPTKDIHFHVNVSNITKEKHVKVCILLQ